MSCRSDLLLQLFAMQSVTASIPTVVSMMRHTSALRSLVKGNQAVLKLTCNSLYSVTICVVSNGVVIV